MYYKQIIVVNKELNMSKGKMAAQVSHASMAFLTHRFLDDDNFATPIHDENQNIIAYSANLIFDKDLYEQWIKGIFAKVILEAKNEAQMVKVVEKAKSFGFVENRDFFCIRDSCLTELIPDETGTRWTCIGFRPMDASEIDPVTKRLQLFKE